MANTNTNTDSLPEQRHAGKVGYGPHYHAGPSLEDKIMGLKEEILGVLTRNPRRASHGHEIMTGKKLAGEDEPNPFEKTGQDGSKKGEENPTGSQDAPPVDHGTNKAGTYDS